MAAAALGGEPTARLDRDGGAPGRLPTWGSTAPPPSPSSRGDSCREPPLGRSRGWSRPAMARRVGGGGMGGAWGRTARSAAAAWAPGAAGRAARASGAAGAHAGSGSSQAGTGTAAAATLGGSGDDSGADELAPRLTLLVESRAGYRNLCRLLSAAAEGRAKGEARASWELIAEHSAGLHCLTGGAERPLGRALRGGGTGG